MVVSKKVKAMIFATIPAILAEVSKELEPIPKQVF